MRLRRQCGNIYAFQPVIREGRATTVYFGSGLVAQLALDVREFVRNRRQTIQNDHQRARQRLQTLDGAARQYQAAIWTLFSGSLYAGGCHLNRRQWRRRSGPQQA